MGGQPLEGVGLADLLPELERGHRPALGLLKVAVEQHPAGVVAGRHHPEARLTDLRGDSHARVGIPVDRLPVAAAQGHEEGPAGGEDLQTGILERRRQPGQLVDESSILFQPVGHTQSGDGADEHLAQRSGVVDPASDGDRLFDEPETFVTAGREDELACEGGAHPGPERRVSSGKGLVGGVEDGDPLLVARADEADEAPAVLDRGPGQRLGVAQVLGQPGRPQQRLAVGGVAGVALGDPEAGDHLAAAAVGSGLDVVEELESLAEEGGRLVGGELLERLPARLGRVGDGLLHRAEPASARAGEVVGEGGGVMDPTGLEELGDLLVAAGPAGDAHLLVQRRAHQGVGEAPTAHAGLEHEMGGDGGVEGVEHGVFLEAAHAQQQLEVEVGTDHRRDREDLVGVVGQAAQAATDHVAHPFGDGDLVDVEVARPAPVALEDGARLDEAAQHLADEEGVALGLGPDGPGELFGALVEVVAGGGLEHGGHAVGVEALDGDALHAGLAAEIGEQRRQRVGPVEVGVAVGANHQQPHGPGRADQVAQQEEGRPLGPVQVVEDEDEPRGRGRGREPGGDGVEETEALGLGVGLERRFQVGEPICELGHEPHQVAGMATQQVVQRVGICIVDQVGKGLDEGLKGDTHPFVAAPVEDDGARPVGEVGHLGRQPGLADARLPGQEDDAPVALEGALPGVHRRLQLDVASDEGDCVRVERRRHGHGAGGGQPLPAHGEGGQALELAATGVLEAVVAAAAGEQADELGHEDLASLGHRAQPGGLHDRGAEAVAVLEGDVAGAHPDTDGDGGVGPGPFDVDALLHHHGCRDGVGSRREQSQHTVAQSLDQRSLVGGDGLGQQGVVTTAQLLGPVLTQPDAQLGRAHQVGDEHRDRLCAVHECPVPPDPWRRSDAKRTNSPAEWRRSQRPAGVIFCHGPFVP